MKKYIITIFVFLGLFIGTGSVLALDIIDSNSLSIKEISKTGVLDYKIDSVNLTASLNVLDKNDYDKVFWQITNGNSTVVLECKVNYKASALPVLMIDSSVDDKSISNEGGCSVEWVLTAVEDGEYTITAKSFLNFDSRIVTSPYDSIAKFVMNTEGDLQEVEVVTVDRTIPIVIVDSLTVKDLTATGFLNSKIDSVNLTASLNVLDKNDYDKVFWQITNGNSTVVLECKVNYKASALPVLMIDSSVDDKSISNEGGCSVEWVLTAVEDGEYTITAKSFLNFDSRIVTSPYDSIAKFVMNTEGDLQAVLQGGVSVDRTVPVITPNSGPESVVRGETYVDPGATVKKGDLIVDDNLKGVNEIDTSSVGSKVITYEYTDEAGNEATAERTVVVENPARRSSSSGSYMLVRVQLVAPVARTEKFWVLNLISSLYYLKEDLLVLR
jgi:hypothetical protein